MELENINLALSENNNSIPNFLVQELKKELLLCNKYPLDIYEEVERMIRRKHSLDENYNVLLGNGLDEVIMMLFISLLSKHGKVLSSSNTFKGYVYAAKALGIPFEEIALKDFRIDVENIIQNINDDTSAVIICNPHNPCGTVLTAVEVEEIVQVANTYSALVFLDEAYIEFVSDNNYQMNVERILSNRNLVVLHTFSKAFGLAGLRCGYAILHNDVLENIEEVTKALPYRVNRLACCAVKVCMRNEKYFYEKIKEINSIKHELYDALDKLNLLYIKSETNFILVRFGENVFKICEILQNEYNIKVRNCSEFSYEFYVRVSIGTKNEMAKFILALGKILEEYTLETS